MSYFLNEFPIFGVDIGNGLWKITRWMTQGGRGYWHVYNDMNVLTQIQKLQYESNIESYAGTERSLGYVGIRVAGKWQYYAMGRTSVAGGHVADWRKTRVMRQGKYRRGYIGLAVAYMIARWYNMMGETVPEIVNVVTAHPPLQASVDFKKQVTKAVRGSWHFHIGGKPVHFRIEGVKVIDEITGGARNLALLPDGRINVDSPIYDRKALLLDIGEGTIDVAILNERGAPVSYDSATVGVFEYIENFGHTFNETFRDILGVHSEGGISLEKIYEIFLHPEHVLEAASWGGPRLDCKVIFYETFTPFFTQLNTLVNRMAGGNLLFAAPQVAITGGAGALLFEDLQYGIFSSYSDNGREDVHLCGSQEDRHMGMYFNAMGMYNDGCAQRIVESYG